MEILVIILSIFLAVFLALGVTLLIYGIRVARHLDSITKKAETAAENFSKASVMFTKAAGPAAIGRMLVNLYESIKHKKEDKNGKG